MTARTIAFDVGGTNTRAAIVDVDGSLDRRISRPTPRDAAALEFIETLASITIELKGDGPSECIGLAIAAVVDSRRNRISRSPNLPQLNDLDLAAEIQQRTELDVFLENDATAAAIGEHWLGAGKGVQNMVCVTLGTGVGGGLIINGEPYYGADGNAGEIGHICIDANGPACGCGSNGCVEQYASGTAIVRQTKENLVRFPESELYSRLDFTSKDAFGAAVNGDAAAIEAFANAGRYLGIAFAGLVNVLNPEVIVICGGVAAGWDLFINATTDEMRKRAFQEPAERVKIVRGTLRDDAGVLGAAKRAFTGKGFS